eukprot:NODE_541_length_1563_cov_430.410172_g407_i0.p1 GENE.NODE_541_length_1563_cov_430.410172_g407_i0~~NODE_541_length_1563_cov_430.410172_g407_i0.p1  ORF type:complete len:464 (-),score=117.83 NODE_541_length_1563_cov_430.410172_g407_i0:170-1504(-)
MAENASFSNVAPPTQSSVEQQGGGYGSYQPISEPTSQPTSSQSQWVNQPATNLPSDPEQALRAIEEANRRSAQQAKQQMEQVETQSMQQLREAQRIASQSNKNIESEGEAREKAATRPLRSAVSSYGAEESFDDRRSGSFRSGRTSPGADSYPSRSGYGGGDSEGVDGGYVGRRFGGYEARRARFSSSTYGGSYGGSYPSSFTSGGSYGGSYPAISTYGGSYGGSYPASSTYGGSYGGSYPAISTYGGYSDGPYPGIPTYGGYSDGLYPPSSAYGRSYGGSYPSSSTYGGSYGGSYPASRYSTFGGSYGGYGNSAIRRHGDFDGGYGGSSGYGGFRGFRGSTPLRYGGSYPEQSWAAPTYGESWRKPEVPTYAYGGRSAPLAPTYSGAYGGSYDPVPYNGGAFVDAPTFASSSRVRYGGSSLPPMGYPSEVARPVYRGGRSRVW